MTHTSTFALRAFAHAASGLATLVLLAPACDRHADQGDGAPASASAIASRSSVATHAGALPSIARWSGTYAAVAGGLYVPDAPEFKGMKFRGEDAGDGLGDGTLWFEIDPVTHTLKGELGGALGELVVGGAVKDDVYAFTVRPKDPSGMGFSGTGRAVPKGTQLAGTLRASRATANIIREATFSLRRP